MPSLDTYLETHGEPEAVEFLIVDPNGLLRGKWAPGTTLKKAFDTGINFPLSIHGLDVWGREVPTTGLHIESGDRDGFFRAVPDSLSLCPWADRPTAQVLLQTFQADNTPFMVDPRQMLAGRLQALAEKGLRPVVALELEFYLVEHGEHGLKSLGGGGDVIRQDMYGAQALEIHRSFFDAVRAGAKAQNLGIDTIVKEAAPGQFEINLTHQSDALRGADEAVLLKRLITNCARQFDLTASFMAKPFAIQPGNGCHVHVSLINEEGENLFSGTEGNARLKNAIAGTLAYAEDSLLGLVNSYNGFRRLQPGSYAPNRPVWGENNRSVAVRVPASDDHNRRLEHRIAGADVNPYILLALVLEAMAEGIEQNLTPSPAIDGNAYDQPDDEFDADMATSIARFSNSPFVTRALGPELAKVYTDLKQAECEELARHISPFECETYL